MMKIIFALLLSISFLSAEINECLSDVYFANGIDTSEDDAKLAIEDINNSIRIKYPNSYKYVANWKVSYNHTHGKGIDLYESFLQKIDESMTTMITWEILDLLDYSFKGLAKKAALKVGKKQIQKAGKEWGKVIAKKIIDKFADRYGLVYVKGVPLNRAAIEAIVDGIFEELIDELVDMYLSMQEDKIREEEESDIETQFKAYKESIKNGHGVVVIAHSQGNFFTNLAYDMFENHILPWEEDTAWMRRYFSALAVASPANDVLGKSEPHITFDNDIIWLAPNSLSANIENPTRYYIDINGTKVENPASIKAHAFLTSYMKEDVTRNHILGFIRNRVDEQTYNKIKRPSQWKPKKDRLCL